MYESYNPLSRRRFLGSSSAALAAVAGLKAADAQQTQGNNEQNSAPVRSPDHHLVNEQEPQPKDAMLDDQNPSSNWPPPTDAGGQPPFKYPFSFSHKRVEGGGWTRQVTVRDMAMSKKMAGVQMFLIQGGVRELHWHVGAEWAYMISGSARITAVDQKGRGFVEDVNAGESVGLSRRHSAFHSGRRPGRRDVPARVRRWQLQRVRNLPADRLAAPHAARGAGKELRRQRVGLRQRAAQRALHLQACRCLARWRKKRRRSRQSTVPSPTASRSSRA